MEKYIEYFLSIVMDCQKKYMKRFSKYGESWKTMSIEELQDRFNEELEECTMSDYDYEEIIDVINIALMLAYQKKKINGEV